MMKSLSRLLLLITILVSENSKAEVFINQNATFYYDSQEKKLDFDKKNTFYQALPTKDGILRQIITKFAPPDLVCFAGNIQFQTKSGWVGLIIDQRSNIDNIKGGRKSKTATQYAKPLNIMVLQLSRGICKLNLEITHYFNEHDTWQQTNLSKEISENYHRSVDPQQDRLSIQERRNLEESHSKLILAEKNQVLSQLQSNGYTIPPHGDPFISTKGLLEGRNIVGLSTEFERSDHCLFTSGNIELKDNTAFFSYFSSIPNPNNNDWLSAAEIKGDTLNSTSIIIYNNRCAFKFNFRIDFD